MEVQRNQPSKTPHRVYFDCLLLRIHSSYSGAYVIRKCARLNRAITISDEELHTAG